MRRAAARSRGEGGHGRSRGALPQLPSVLGATELELLIMRKLIVFLSLFVATAAFAQQNKPNGFFIFVTNPGYAREPGGNECNGAFGFALQRMFSPRFSGEIAISHDSETFGFRSF